MGDTGALFLGFSLALLTLEGYRTTALLTFVVPLLALAVPLMDTALSILRRLREHRPVFSADKRHMHHRLLESEGSDRGAVLSLYFLTGCFCIIAVSFTRLQGYAAIVFLGAVAILTIRLLWNLGVFSKSEASDSAKSPERVAEPPQKAQGGET
jgi:UDP-GlcNAc:undecaprenyl-phosphate GlcNAc-1-phosphate transferase